MLLIYRYRALPTHQQKEELRRVWRSVGLTVWNGLVGRYVYALRQIRQGRADSIRRELRRLDGAKAKTGIRAKKLAEDPAWGKDFSKLQGRALAQAYALDATARAKQKKIGRAYGALVAALYRRFRDAKRPKLKEPDALASLVAQHQGDFAAGERMPLSRILSEPVRVIYHRPVPESARIKQYQIVERGDGEWDACLYVELPDEEAKIEYPAAQGKAVGIDPGMKIALTAGAADGEPSSKMLIAPPRALVRRLLRRRERAARTFSRRKPGSKRRDRARIALGKIDARIVNVRKEIYLRAADRLLSSYDLIGVGSWRHRGRSKMGEMRRRVSAGLNRKDRLNANGQFRLILSERAARASNPKRVIEVNESGTTRTCRHCGAPTGPSGIEGLDKRTWVCSACGAEHDRDFSSAVAIGRKAVEIAKEPTGAHPVRGAKAPKARRSPKRAASPLGPRTRECQTSASAEVLRREAEALAAPKSLTASGLCDLPEPGGLCAGGGRATARKEVWRQLSLNELCESPRSG